MYIAEQKKIKKKKNITFFANNEQYVVIQAKDSFFWI